MSLRFLPAYSTMQVVNMNYAKFVDKITFLGSVFIQTKQILKYSYKTLFLQRKKGETVETDSLMRTCLFYMKCCLALW
jgi:hypothetical protein